MKISSKILLKIKSIKLFIVVIEISVIMFLAACFPGYKTFKNVAIKRWKGFEKVKTINAVGEIKVRNEQNNFPSIPGKVILNLSEGKIRMDFINPAGFVEGVLLMRKGKALFINKYGQRSHYKSVEEFFIESAGIDINFNLFYSIFKGDTFLNTLKKGRVINDKRCQIQSRYNNMNMLIDLKCADLIPEAIRITYAKVRVIEKEFVDYGDFTYPKIIILKGIKGSVKIELSEIKINKKIKESLFEELE